MKLKTPTLLAALVLIGIGGFMAGRVTSPAASNTASDVPTDTKSVRSSSRETIGSDADAKRTPRTGKTGRDASGTSKDRLAKLEEIIRGENPLDRNRALLSFIDQLGPADFAEAIAHFRDLGVTENRMGEYSLLLTAWAQVDPMAALEYATENTNGGFAQETILTSWATTDPEAAIRWATANHEGDEANPYLPGIIRGLFQADPNRATELLAGMPRSEERGKGLEFILPHLLQKGADATRTWIASITDENLKNGAIQRTANKLAETDPAGTAAWLLANPGEGSQRRLDDVYGTWAEKDQQAALSSLNSLPAGETRTNALRGVIRSVAVEDPKAALALMNRYPNDVNDQVVQNFVWHSMGSDPATALAQVPRIGNEQEREQIYRRTLNSWFNRDPDSAQAWIQANPIPDSVRERLARRQARDQ